MTYDSIFDDVKKVPFLRKPVAVVKHGAGVYISSI